MLLVIACASPARAQQAAAQPFALPTAKDSWLNSPPLSSEILLGKGIVLWFFEEQCVKCAGKWPEMIAFAQQYQDKPVVFIAVNSGTNPAAIQAYLKKHKVPWPTIVDPDRSFEHLCGVEEISLQNIHQARYVSYDGQLHRGNWEDLAGTVSKALEGTAWRVDPATVPEALKPAWLQVELGNFAVAAPLIKKSLKAKDSDVRGVAETMLAAVTREIADRVAEANDSLAVGEKWLAYQQFDRIAATFKGFDLPPQVEEKTTELASDKSIENQIAAHERLSAAKKLGSRGTPAAVKRAVTMLEKLVESYPDTQAALEAQEILAKVKQ
jgi:thiol-disulfide isomerase/thioredoxin